jgi:hypothetical protein
VLAKAAHDAQIVVFVFIAINEQRQLTGKQRQAVTFTYYCCRYEIGKEAQINTKLARIRYLKDTYFLQLQSIRGLLTVLWIYECWNKHVCNKLCSRCCMGSNIHYTHNYVHYTLKTNFFVLFDKHRLLAAINKGRSKVGITSVKHGAN